ncbi:MAG: hypothetical protein QM729_06960 [Solirubrobacterales bacterium]
MSAQTVVAPDVLAATAGGLTDAARQAALPAAPVAARQATRADRTSGVSRHGAALSRVEVLPRSPRHIEVGT